MTVFTEGAPANRLAGTSGQIALLIILPTGTGCHKLATSRVTLKYFDVGVRDLEDDLTKAAREKFQQISAHLDKTRARNSNKSLQRDTVSHHEQCQVTVSLSGQPKRESPFRGFTVRGALAC